jgi:hypothetical protein
MSPQSNGNQNRDGPTSISDQTDTIIGQNLALGANVPVRTRAGIKEAITPGTETTHRLNHEVIITSNLLPWLALRGADSRGPPLAGVSKPRTKYFRAKGIISPRIPPFGELPQGDGGRHYENSKDSKESKGLSGMARQAHGHGVVKAFFDFWFLVVYRNA